MKFAMSYLGITNNLDLRFVDSHEVAVSPNVSLKGERTHTTCMATCLLFCGGDFSPPQRRSCYNRGHTTCFNMEAQRVARTRLKEKVNRIKDVQGRLQFQVEYLEKLDGECGSAFESITLQVNDAITALLKSFEEHKAKLICKLKSISDSKTAVLAERKRTCQDVLHQSTQVQ